MRPVHLWDCLVDTGEQHQRAASGDLNRCQRLNRNIIDEPTIEGRPPRDVCDRHERRNAAAGHQCLAKLLRIVQGASRDELWPETKRAPEPRVHRMKELLLQLIHADTDGRADRWGQAAR